MMAAKSDNAAVRWPAELVDELAQDLAARPARLWQVADPVALAQWVFAEPWPAPLVPAPAALEGDWAAGLDAAQRAAWTLTGWMIRMTVPEALRTAGTHWLVSDRVDRGRSLLRLTVGVLETFGVHQDGAGVWLRVALAPFGLAGETGALDVEQWRERGVERFDDTTKTLAEDKIGLSCPDVETAWWLLRQPPVLAAARLLNVMLAVNGRFPYPGRYRPEVAARAWAAAETVFTGPGAATPDGDPGVEPGFDRPYAGPAAPADLPGQRAFDGDAYRAGVDEHDRICRQLIAHLGRSGVRAGAGLHGVPVDLAWRDATGRHVIAEVKSVAGGNGTDQLRLGLGQVLEYRHRLATRGAPVTALLVVSRCDDPVWRDICADNGVELLVADGNWADRQWSG
ncbi:hypothetical protein V6U90_14300 [Micromonospora sp. CPCC 206060]|uniref:hypothetical protein n=1 Tax=Micromonospora sp. CPCC 206060 TaxID=3122406 RepID=UPI002FF00E03